MGKPSIQALTHRAGVAKRKRDLVRELLAMGCGPGATLAGITRRARADLERINRQAKPYIQSGASLSPRRREA